MNNLELLQVFEFDRKIRLGSNNDGGYVIAELDNIDYDCYISAGVSDNESFSKDFINKYNMNKNNSFAFDETINDYPSNYTDKISFIKKNINDENLSKYNNIFLKMDIKGGEYAWLLQIEENQLNKFRQIVIELYGITNDEWNCDYNDKIKCLEKLSKTHYIVHAHGNNYAPVLNNIPDVIQLTYVNKNYFKTIPELNTKCLPNISLDFPNNIHVKDINLDFYPFVKVTKQEKKIGIVIISDVQIFSNGLIQNAYYLYQCLENSGHRCEFLCYDTNPKPFNHKKISVKTISSNPSIFSAIDYKAIITVSTGIDTDIYEYLKKYNVAIIGFVCGCTLMMDQDSFINMNSIKTYISKSTKIDELWVIPSYKYMLDYVEITRNAPAFIVPHLWSNECIKEDLKHRYNQEENVLFYNIEKCKNKKINIIILEPNLYIVKNSWIPIVIAEKLHQKYPNLIDNVYVFGYPEHNKAYDMIESLSVSSKVRRFKRLAISNIINYFNNDSQSFPVYLSTQLYNSLNYTYYEILYYGYPLIHNSLDLEDQGYYYPEFEISKAVDCILKAYKNHDKNVDIIKDKAKKYLERVDPFNNDVCKTINGMLTSAIVNANK